MNPGAAWQWAAGLSALGMYIFLAVWVAALLWSRTKERLAIQETVRRLIDSGSQLTPDIIDSLRRPKPPRTAAEQMTRIRRFRYWGIFLIGLGSVMALYRLGVGYSSAMAFPFFVIPGLFCLAYSIITDLVARTELK